MGNVKITINGENIIADENSTILEAAKKAKINIPTLCYHPDLEVKGNCRVCLVEVDGARTLQASCLSKVKEGMVIKTNTKKVRDARKTVLKLILANHNQDCSFCKSNGKCELQKLTNELNITENNYDNVLEKTLIKSDNPSVVRDMNKCIKCGRCVQVCNDVQSVGAIYNLNRSLDMHIGPAFDRSLTDVPCALCGQCINVCPVGAIYEKSDIDNVFEALEDENKHVIVQIAPAVRVSVGEEFGLKPGSIVTGKIPSVLRRMGFDKVFDTDFTADLTILEEGTEFLGRLQNNGTLPMLTSCSPGWIRYIEYFYPELLDHLSTCKSPQQMFGALAKTYYSEKIGIPSEDIVVVSIMPCTAKKAEAVRDEMKNDTYQDVDYVLTTREFAAMIKQLGYDLNSVEEEEFDDPFGITTGAGVIFGASGGVMEAALRTVYEVVTKEELKDINFTAVRGLQGIKEAEVQVGDITVKIAVASSLSNAKVLLDKIKSGESDYHFIEIMCCPGGCIGGGGQPKPFTNEIRKQRIAGIYTADERMQIRKSHKNPAVLKLYEEYLEKPNSHKSHELLHTHYINRKELVK